MSFSAADWVSAVRIALVPAITAALWQGQREVAAGLYLLAPVSDVLDGRLARRNPGSVRRVDIDGLADVVFGVSMIGWAYWQLPAQRAWIEIYLAAVAVPMTLFVAVSLALAGKVLLLHLWSAKLMAWIGFFWFGSSCFLGTGDWAIHLVGVAACWVYAESAVYLLRGRRDPNGRSAFF